MSAEFEFALGLVPIPAAIVSADGSIVSSNTPFRERVGATEGLSLADFDIDLGTEIDRGNGRLHRITHQAEGGGSADSIAILRPVPADESRFLILRCGEEFAPEDERELRELARFPLVNPSPVLRLDKDGQIVACNPAAERLFGDDDLAQAQWIDVCPGIDRRFWGRVLGDDRPPSVEVTIGDQSVRFDHVRAPSGELVTAFGVITTDFRRVERELAQKASELSELAWFPDMNPGPVIRTDFEGRILLANVAAKDVFGAELVDQDWHVVCPKLDADEWQRIVVSGEPTAIEGRVHGRDFVFNHRSDPKTGLVFVYGTDVTLQKQAEQALRQSEKMATLGTLAAGVAHELNNPAAATRRAADQLKDKLSDLEAAHLAFNPAAHSAAVRTALHGLLDHARSAGSKAGELDAMARSDKETELEDWLEEHGVEDPWDVAPDLVGAGLDAEQMAPLADGLEGAELAAALNWTAAAYNVASLANTVSQGAARLSEIVGALKGYSYLGQAPIQEVDLTEGLENTLVIMRSKLKYGITVHRQYAEDMPAVPAYGSELNQV